MNVSPIRTRFFRRWFQVRIVTLLLVTATVAVGFGWRKDRQRLYQELRDQIHRTTQLELQVEQLTEDAATLKRQLDHEMDVRRTIAMLDPKNQRHQDVIQVLASLGSSLRRVSLHETPEGRLEMLVGHRSIPTVPGSESSVVVLRQYVMVPFAGSFAEDVKVVDCLAKHSRYRLFGGEHHHVAVADIDSDGRQELIFECRNNDKSWKEVYRAGSDGFAPIDAGVLD